MTKQEKMIEDIKRLQDMYNGDAEAMADMSAAYAAMRPPDLKLVADDSTPWPAKRGRARPTAAELGLKVIGAWCGAQCLSKGEAQNRRALEGARELSGGIPGEIRFCGLCGAYHVIREAA